MNPSKDLITKLNMANEKFTLTWHSYTSHFQGVFSNLFDTGESSDVTLVCDDQAKFKPLLNFIYSGQAYFYQETRKDERLP